MLGPFTTEKRDVSSAKSLAVEVIFSDRSLMYNKRNTEPKTDPFGTPALTGNRFDDCPLSITSAIQKIVNNYWGFTRNTCLS